MFDFSSVGLETKASVIIPARNAERYIERCLNSVFEAAVQNMQVVLVNDGSTDATVRIARKFPCEILEVSDRMGPYRARNLGFDSSAGEIVFFFDADQVMDGRYIETAMCSFKDPGIDCVHGIFHWSVPGCGVVETYKNFCHHHRHIRLSERPEHLFSAGLTAIRRTTFNLAGYFEQHPIADIKYGYRLKQIGIKIHYEPEMVARHLKEYSVIGLLYGDIMHRAIPWSELVLAGSFGSDGTTDQKVRISEQSYHPFRSKVTTDFGAKLPPVSV